LSKQSEKDELAAESGFAEEELIHKARMGDVQAYGSLVEKYQYRIFNLIRRLVSQEDVVEDLAQEVFIKVFRKIGDFRAESSFYTWMYKIALNTCRNYYRRQSPTVVELDRYEERDSLPGTVSPETPEEVLFRQRRAGQVREALDKLPPEQKEVLVMRDLEGFSYQEIAVILELPIGTVRSRIFRGRYNMKGLLTDGFEEEEG
jgi:RNA polymerase sigma-70 factor (ECF subfamily)